jgi:peptidoglycan/LPS O-acetylase OafA/YrhL
MKRLSDRFQRAPLGTVFLVLAVLVFVVRILVEALLLDDGLSLGRAVATLVTSLLFAAVMTFVVARQRRRSGGTDTMADVTTAVKERQLPPHADPGVWIPALEWRRRQFQRSLWLTPVLAVIAVAMGVAAVVLIPDSIAGWIVVVAFVGLTVASVVQVRRTLPRIDDLLRQLRARTDADGRGADAAQAAPTSPRSGV